MFEKITLEELREMFGTHIPMDVIMALENWGERPENLSALRVYLTIRAKSWREENAA